MGTKNSLLSCIFLPLVVVEWRRFPMKNFRPKKVKILDFELQKRYIPQKKAKIMYNWDSAIKSTIFCKKKYFFKFLDFRVMFEAGWKFSTSSFSKFSKKNQKNGITRTWKMLKGTKSWKISPFEAFCEESREINYPRGCFTPPPCVE